MPSVVHSLESLYGTQDQVREELLGEYKYAGNVMNVLDLTMPDLVDCFLLLSYQFPLLIDGVFLQEIPAGWG